MKKWPQWVAPGAKALSAKGLFTRALVLAGAFFISHLIGLREHTTVLCGTYPGSGSAAKLLAPLGLLYAIQYIAFVILVPILVIAAAILWGLRQVLSTEEGNDSK